MADLISRKQISGALSSGLATRNFAGSRPAGKSGTQFFANTESPGFGQISGPVTMAGANTMFPPSKGKTDGSGLQGFMTG